MCDTAALDAALHSKSGLPKFTIQFGCKCVSNLSQMKKKYVPMYRLHTYHETVFLEVLLTRKVLKQEAFWWHPPSFISSLTLVTWHCRSEPSVLPSLFTPLSHHYRRVYSHHTKFYTGPFNSRSIATIFVVNGDREFTRLDPRFSRVVAM